MTTNKNVFLIILSFCFSILAIAQVNLQQGLVAYYPFNGNANDESGNGNNGTVYGAALTEDRFGNENSAFYFNGINEYIICGNNSLINLTQHISLTCWIKHNTGNPINWEDIFMKGNTSYGFQFNSGNHSFCFHLTSNGWQNLSSFVIPDTGKWYQLIGTYDGSIQKIYVNGQLMNTSFWNGTIQTNSDPLTIGYMVAGDNNWFNGVLDEIRIYNRALNDLEIQALYNENQPPQTNIISNILINPRPEGSGLVDVNFDLSGTANHYSISLEASFDGGISYTPIQDSFLSGDIGPVEKGNSKHIVWDGVESFPNIYSIQAKLKIVASQLGAPCASMPTITDIDGNIYNTVQIGSQCWMKENLNTGTRIAGATNQTDNGVIEKYCYDDDESNCDIYGGLYQWDEMMQYSAIEGTQGICTEGWHLPTETEWATLISYLLGFQVAGGKMKTTGTLEAGTGLWYSPNTGATNNSGFAGLPSGWRRSNGEPLFDHQGNIGHLWSSSTRYDYGVIQQLANSGATSSWAYSWKSGGLPVRCLKNN